MRRLRFVLVGLAVVIALAVIVPAGIVGGLVAWVKFSPPPASGDVRLAGLAAPVRLVWDRNAVPHIFAASMRDAYRTLGWVHARDRLWQMETQRRIGQGRLAELVGTLGLDLDREMRVLGLYRLAEASYGALDADTRADLDAYAAGVNAYLDHPVAPLPLEFQLLHITPEPWRPADSLVFGKLMALQLSSNYREEALRAALAARLPPDVMNDLMPDTPTAGFTTLALKGIDWRRFAQNLPPVLGPDRASNEWVVDGSLTRSGKPLLANDPHLGLSAPILWYLVRIVTPGGSIAGATFPGAPFHILGHNDHVAWGVTTTGGDVEDLFVEDVAPGDPTRYVTPDGTAPFVTRDETIHVRFGADVHLTVRETRHGPVMSDIDPDLAAAVGPGKAVALAFVGLDPADTTTQAFRQMNLARDWPSFQAALKLWKTPEQNMVYADTDGHIAFTSVGPLPLRKRPTDDLPAPGSSGVADWTGLADFSQLPQAVDPPGHRFINANNRVVPQDFPIYVARHYDDNPFRADRIAEMLDETNAYTAPDFGRMQMDVKENDSDMLLPKLLAAHPASDAGRRAIDMLQGWDRLMRRDRPEPLIYAAWVTRLQQALVKKRLGAAADLAPEFGYYKENLIARLLDRYAAEGSGGGSGEAAPILQATLDDAMTALAGTYGQDIAAWRWGDSHRATLTSQLLGRIPLLGGLFDVGLPASGGPETINAGGFFSSDGVHFPDSHGPGYRGVYDLADLDASRFIIATGESGNPLSPHYGDMAERWRSGDAVTLAGSEAEVAAAGLGRQVFSP
jgi:penicillin amidase